MKQRHGGAFGKPRSPRSLGELPAGWDDSNTAIYTEDEDGNLCFAGGSRAAHLKTVRCLIVGHVLDAVGRCEQGAQVLAELAATAPTEDAEVIAGEIQMLARGICASGCRRSVMTTRVRGLPARLASVRLHSREAPTSWRQWRRSMRNTAPPQSTPSAPLLSLPGEAAQTIRDYSAASRLWLGPPKCCRSLTARSRGRATQPRTHGPTREPLVFSR